MDTARLRYLGELRNEAVHTRSGQVIITDAPPDNKGRGEAFSPTDLLCTSLGACMMTLMGIAARERKLDLKGLTARVVKHMQPQPRRVARVEVHLELEGAGLDERDRAVLEHAARTCPVALSLSPEIEQEVHFTYR